MSQTPGLDEQEFLIEQQQALRKSVEFYAPENKAKREACVCSDFLANLGIQYDERELVPEPSDPPDIHFRGAQFEVKEILDLGRKRHLEYREKLEKALSVTSASELHEQFTPKDLTFAEISDLVAERLPGWYAHYDPKISAQLDLVIYVNLLRRPLDSQSQVPDISKFSGSGWRSISVLKGWIAWTLYARTDAPLFLLASRGQPVFRPGTK